MPHRQSSHTPMFDPPKSRGSIASVTGGVADEPGFAMSIVGQTTGTLFPTGGPADSQIFKRGNYCYVWGDLDVSIVDVSVPGAPVIVGTCTHASIDDMRWGGVLDYPHLYIAEGGSNGGFHVFNVSNPASPSHIAYYNDGDVGPPGDTFTSATIGGLIKEGNLIYAVDWAWGSIYIVNVSTPSSPTTVGYLADGLFPFASDEWDIVKDGNFVYSTSIYDGSIIAWNVSNPASPTRAGDITESVIDGIWQAIVKRGDLVYATGDAVAGFGVFDFSDPTDPQLLGSINSTAYLPAPENSMLVSGSYAYVPGYNRFISGTGNVGALTLVDVSDSANPRIASSVQDVRLSASYPRLLKRGTRILQPSYRGVGGLNANGGVSAVNVADPDAPFIEARVTIPECAMGIAVDGDYLYAWSWATEDLYVVSLVV